MKKPLYLLILIFLLVHPLFAEDTTEETDVSDSTIEEPVKSIEEERIEVLEFGIDTEVLEVLNAIRSDKSSYYNDHLLDVLSHTRNKDIQELIFFIFTDLKSDEGVPEAIAVLNKVVEDESVADKVVISAISYLGEIKSADASSILYDVILMDGSDDYQAPALRALGKIGDAERAEELLSLLEELDYEDESEQLTSALILTLGELKYQPAFSILLEIADDDYASITNRQYACSALGELGNPEAIDVLIDIYGREENSYLRAYALSGISSFQSDPRSDEMLMEALKRDSFWRVRVAAAEGIGKRSLIQAHDLLVYKCEKDPIPQVRQACFTAMSQLQTEEANQYLLDYYANKDNPGTYRISVLNTLLDSKINGTVEIIEETFKNEWDNTTTQIIEYSGRILAVTHWSELRSIYELMLTHPETNIRLYGIRGIKLNEILESYPQVRALDQEGENPQVRKEASGLASEE